MRARGLEAGWLGGKRAGGEARRPTLRLVAVEERERAPEHRFSLGEKQIEGLARERGESRGTTFQVVIQLAGLVGESRLRAPLLADTLTWAQLLLPAGFPLRENRKE